MKESTGRKKILLITPMLHQGGFERVCVMTARLLEKEYDVCIAVFSIEDIAFDITGLNVIDLNLKARKGKLQKVINILKRSCSLTRLQKKYGIDVSYSFGTTANIANAFSHGACRRLAACHSFEEIKDKKYMRLIGRRSHQVLCCSKKMAALVQEKYGFKNVKALWNPCDIEEIQRQSKAALGQESAFFQTKDKILVSMGREDDVKGFWHLLKVFRRIYEQNAHTRLAVIGEGSFTEYRQLVKDLEIDEQVLFTGLKKNPFPYLKAADIYMLTSISEGLPNALIEALAVSLPVISVNCLSGPAEILHGNWMEAENQRVVFEADYGILTPVLSPQKELRTEWKNTAEKQIRLEAAEENLAQAVLMLLQDKEKYENYRKTALKRAGDFSGNNYLKDLISCMEGL